MFDSWRGFADTTLPAEWYRTLTEKARMARGEIIKMTTVAASGHPGGSMSSLEMYLLLYHFAKVDPKDPYRDERDRIIISHGHTSPGAYTALAAAGFFDVGPALWGFRQAGSPFEGHVERSVPGIEWDTGNLGQGLSVGCGKALYARMSGQEFHTYVVMGDGEQQKGQIAEARRFAVKYRLNNLTALVDFNRLQISGKLTDVMPQQVKAGWESDGWRVIEVDGHDLNRLYATLREATLSQEAPVMILAHTVMGKGVSFMENDENYHGAPLSMDQARKAFVELGGIADDLEALVARRKSGPPPAFATQHAAYPRIAPGSPANYGSEEKLDNRGAFGKALVSVAEANMGKPGIAMGVFDCDLAKSVKTDGFAKKYPGSFFQCGISEHNTATMAGALSAEQAVAVWADFGVFGIDETYNQARLNDINHSNLKLFCTHSGVMVGEDGKTHQCIDYFSLLNSTFGWKVITPADPNQTDRVVRYVLSTPGNFAVIMGRSVAPIITTEEGEPYFAGAYRYQYGRMEWLRTGGQVALVAAGNIVPTAMHAWSALQAEGVRISLVCVADWSDLHVEDLGSLARYQDLVVLEDHNVKSGLGAALSAALFENGCRTRLTRMGVTRYGSSGKPDDLYKLLGIDAGSVATKVRSLLIEKSVVR
jgi:transketolase